MLVAVSICSAGWGGSRDSTVVVEEGEGDASESLPSLSSPSSRCPTVVKQQ